MKVLNRMTEKSRSERSAQVKRGSEAYGRSGAKAAEGRRGDSVRVSSTAAGLADAVKEMAQDKPMGVSEARIQELKEAIQAGEYHVDPHQLAAAIIDSDIGTSGE